MNASTEEYDWNPFSFSRIPHVGNSSTSTSRNPSVESDAAPFKLPAPRKRPGAPSPSPPPRRRQKTDPSPSPPLTPPTTEGDDDSDTSQKPVQTRSATSSGRGSAKRKSKEKKSKSIKSKTKMRSEKNTPVKDILRKNLDVVFCGPRTGTKAAEAGQFYADRRQGFWRALEASGLTDRLLHFEEARLLSKNYGIGVTILVRNPAKPKEKKLSKEEQLASFPSLLKRIVRFRPRIFAFTGKGISSLFLEYINSLPPPSSSNTKKKTSEIVLDLHTQKGELLPFVLTLPPRNSRGTERDKVYFWYTSNTAGGNGCLTDADHARNFSKIAQDLKLLRESNLPLPRNTIQYRAEDLPLPPIGESDSDFDSDSDSDTKSEQDESLASDEGGEENTEELPNIEEVRRLKKANKELQMENEESKEENEKLKAEIERLRAKIRKSR